MRRVLTFDRLHLATRKPIYNFIGTGDSNTATKTCMMRDMNNICVQHIAWLNTWVHTWEHSVIVSVDWPRGHQRNPWSIPMIDWMSILQNLEGIYLLAFMSPMYTFCTQDLHSTRSKQTPFVRTCTFYTQFFQEACQNHPHWRSRHSGRHLVIFKWSSVILSVTWADTLSSIGCHRCIWVAIRKGTKFNEWPASQSAR